MLRSHADVTARPPPAPTLMTRHAPGQSTVVTGTDTVGKRSAARFDEHMRQCIHGGRTGFQNKATTHALSIILSLSLLPPLVSYIAEIVTLLVDDIKSLFFPYTLSTSRYTLVFPLADNISFLFLCLACHTDETGWLGTHEVSSQRAEPGDRARPQGPSVSNTPRLVVYRSACKNM